MRIIVLLILTSLVVACGNPKKKPEVVTSQGRSIGQDADNIAGQGGQKPQDIGVLDAELPIEERAFKQAAEGDFSLLESLVVYFDFDSTTILPEYQKNLETHARFLETYPQVKVSIAGHCDERGSPEYNMALGQRRASSVAQLLRSLNVSSEQLSNIHSYGSNRLAAFGDAEDDHAKNRRVEINYQVQ